MLDRRCGGYRPQRGKTASGTVGGMPKVVLHHTVLSVEAAKNERMDLSFAACAASPRISTTTKFGGAGKATCQVVGRTDLTLAGCTAACISFMRGDSTWALRLKTRRVPETDAGHRHKAWRVGVEGSQADTGGAWLLEAPHCVDLRHYGSLSWLNRSGYGL